MIFGSGFRKSQTRSRAAKNRKQPTETLRTRNVSPERFLLENRRFLQFKSRTKSLKNATLAKQRVRKELL